MSERYSESPQFMRAYFPDNISLSGKTLFGGSCISNTLLDPIFSPVHNSHIYAFTLPSKSLMEGSYKFEYNLKSTASAFGEHSVNYPIMALRVIVCRDVDKSKSKLE
uniref:Uncharacterized protein n=1 Tax=Ditylenchus dipsaci TaxID=166011 RepID=A0A915DHD8_9BILA